MFPCVLFCVLFLFSFARLVHVTASTHTVLGKTCLTCGLVHLKGDKQKIPSIQYIFLPQGGNVAKLLFSLLLFVFCPHSGVTGSVSGQQDYSHSCCVVHQSAPLLLSMCPRFSSLHSHIATSAVESMLLNYARYDITVNICISFCSFIQPLSFQQYLVTTRNDNYNEEQRLLFSLSGSGHRVETPPNTHTAAEA